MPLFRAPMVDVVLQRAIQLDSGETVRNYTRGFYIQARDLPDAMTLLSHHVAGERGEIIAMDPVYAVKELPSDLLARTLNPAEGRGVIWKSGRAFYLPE